MGSVEFVQTDEKTFVNLAPKRQCKEGLDLTGLTDSGPNPMTYKNNYTTCFDLTNFNITGDRSIDNLFYFGWCKNGTGVSCASIEKR